MAKIITRDNFEEEVINAQKPVLLDFWADWCMPCRALGPIVEQVAEEYAGRLTVGKVDIVEYPDLAERHQITAIPTLVVYNKGAVVNQFVGGLPKDALIDLFAEFI
jgi:thioredoxin 1